MKKIILAGATGNLGGMVARELLSIPNTTVSCLVRRESEETKVLSKLGATIHLVDFNDVKKLKSVCKEAYSIVSALQGDESVILDTQLNLFEVANEVKASRFFSSDFSSDFFHLNYGDNWFLDLRKKFAEKASQQTGNTQLVHTLNGSFLDMNVLFGFLGAFDLKNKTVNYWGEGNMKMDFTTYGDTARYTALAAVSENDVPAKFTIAGDQLTFHELVEVVNSKVKTAYKKERLGTLDDLDNEISKRINANSTNIYSFIPLMYYRAMLNGKGALSNLKNSLFTEFRPKTVKEYITENAHHF